MFCGATAEHVMLAGARLGVAHQARQIRHLSDGLALEAGDDVARLDAGLLRGRLFHATHQRALWLAQANRLGHVLGHGFDLHPDAPGVTRPLVRSCSLTRMASSIGIANEMPMKPPERE